MGTRGDVEGNTRSDKGTGRAGKRVNKLCKIIFCNNKANKRGVCGDHKSTPKWPDGEFQPYWMKGWKVRVSDHPSAPSKPYITLRKWILYDKYKGHCPCEICGHYQDIRELKNLNFTEGGNVKSFLVCQSCRMRMKGDRWKPRMPTKHIAELKLWDKCIQIGRENAENGRHNL